MKCSRFPTYISLVVMIALLLGACSKMDSNYKQFLKGGEKIYQVLADSIQVFPGHNRIELSWKLLSSPNITNCTVFWNNGMDSTVVPVSAGKDWIDVSTIISPIAEGSYTFEIYTNDKAGNSSVAADTIGRVYGDVYLSTLINRPIGSAELIAGKPRIEWLRETDTTAIGMEVRYVDQAGASHETLLPITDSLISIDDVPQGDSVQYRTLFLPTSWAIDTFYTPYETLNLEEAVPVALDKSLFKALDLTTDAPLYNSKANPMSNLWDGDLTTWYRTANGSGSPHWYTLDLGVTAKLSSYTVWQRGVKTEYNLVYANANDRAWEVWGSENPNEDGSWDSWIKLADCISTKPSGLPLGSTTDEDISYALNGETFQLSKDAPPVRYIRIKVLDTWDHTAADHSFASELTFYGIKE